MSTTAPIRTALIGYGVAGQLFHAPFIAANPDYQLTHIVTGNRHRASAAHQSYPQTTLLDTTAQLFDEASQLDLVVVATPPDTHVDVAGTALEHELHVVVDKPFAPTAAQAQALIAQADRRGRVLTVFQNRRWDGDFLTLRQLIQHGQLGQVFDFQSRFEWWRPESPTGWKATTPITGGGGILFDLGSHLIDQAVLLFGPVEDVTAHTTCRATHHSTGPDDDTQVILLHTSGTRSTLVMSAWAALPGPRFHALGSRAAYLKWGFDPQESALADGVPPVDSGFGLEPRQQWGRIGSPDSQDAVKTQRGDYGQFYWRLAAAIRHGDPLPVNPHEALEVVRVIERAHASSHARASADHDLKGRHARVH